VKITAKSLMNSATPAFPNSIHIAPRGHVAPRGHAAVITLFVATTLTGLTHAAPRFDPANEPQVYLAPIALSNADLRPVADLRPNGGAMAFRPWFENGAWQGDLIELDVSVTGAVSSTVDLGPVVPTTTPDGNWSARIQFNTIANSNEDFWDDGTRLIAIGNGRGNTGDAIPFRFSEINADQRNTIVSGAQVNAPERIINFIRGDRSSEQSPDNPSGDLRRRLNVLGAIIHSPPKYVAEPNQNFSFNGYPAFAATNANRAPRVYVGANDGMLHSFDVLTGDEVFAYIPSMVTANLGRLSRLPYSHTYFVDGQLAIGDVFINNQWRTVLVGGLGAGGRGFYALDITDPNISSENALADRLLWEIDGSDNDIGFSYSRPTIARLNDDRWYAIMGNGYNSQSGDAKLLIVDIETGNVRELTADTGNNADPNGLSSPSLIDIENDDRADFAYAGDIDGNLWKFDLSSNTPVQWNVAFNGTALLELGDEHPIIIPPDVVPIGITNGFFVYVGTGRAFTPADLENNDVQSLYGVIDNLQPPTPGNLNLVDQILDESVFPIPLQVVRTTSSTSVNPTGENANRAWRVNTPAGERFLTELQTRAGRVQALTFNPIENPNENWLTQPAFSTGGAPFNTVLDLNGDSNLDVNDHVDGSDPDITITNAPEDIPMGLLLGQGIRSRPTIAVVTAEIDTALINGLFVSAINNCPERFQDICLGQLTNLDEFQNELDQLQRDINRLNLLISALQAELNRLLTDQTTLQQQLATLLAEQNPDQTAIDDTQALLDGANKDISDKEGDRDRAQRERNNLKGQQDRAIEFRNAAEEDTLKRENGGERDISDIAVAGIRNLGPNFALGRRSWVELDTAAP